MDGEEADVLDRERLQDGLYVDWPSIFALEQLVVMEVIGYACTLEPVGRDQRGTRHRFNLLRWS
jgi:hypothetical protein